jgi:gas vesicle protein
MRETDTFTRGEAAAAGGAGFTMGLLCGAAAGIAVGLLFAPKAGAELRGQVAETADRLRRKAGRKLDDVSGSVNDLVDKGRRTYGRAMDTMDDLVDRGRNAVQQGQQAFDDARSSIKDTYDETH